MPFKDILKMVEPNMQPKCIFIITGEHPYDCIGGAELQAYLIAKNIKDYFEKTVFCTVFSKRAIINIESDLLIHISLKNEFLLKKIFRFVKYVKENKPQIIYVRCLYSFWWINLIARLFVIPVVYHISGDSQCRFAKINGSRFLAGLLKNFYIYNTQFANLVIAQTKTQASIYQETFRKLPAVVYNAQLPDELHYPKDYSKIKILWIGKQFKKPERFIELYEMMKDESKYEFLLGGIFSDEQVSNFKHINNQNHNFKFLGKLTRQEVYHYLQESHVLINTSELEGFPNTFIEAWQRGVIVISDKINPDNILTEKKIGFVCENIGEIKTTIEELFSNDLSTAKEYAARAIKYASLNHNMQITAQNIYQLLKPLIQINGKSYIS